MDLYLDSPCSGYSKVVSLLCADIWKFLESFQFVLKAPDTSWMQSVFISSITCLPNFCRHSIFVLESKKLFQVVWMVQLNNCLKTSNSNFWCTLGLQILVQLLSFRFERKPEVSKESKGNSWGLKRVEGKILEFWAWKFKWANSNKLDLEFCFAPYLQEE